MGEIGFIYILYWKVEIRTKDFEGGGKEEKERKERYSNGNKVKRRQFRNNKEILFKKSTKT